MVFTKVLMVSAVSQQVIINFGYFFKKICHTDFSKIAQSGFTVYNQYGICLKTGQVLVHDSVNRHRRKDRRL